MKSQEPFTKTFSFELFPPKTGAGMEKLQHNVRELSRLDPLYFSVTFGAGGSTRERTFDSVQWLASEGLDTAPHLSCIGSTRSEIVEILDQYKAQGVRRVVALRGDLPSGAGLGGLGELNYANELVGLIREEFADHFHIEVAAYPEFHPQAPNANADLKNFMRKVEAGADGAITQYFYNPDAYYRFIDSCEGMGLAIPVVPGIMPITNYSSLMRFSDACGAEIPRWIRKRLEAYGDDIESIRAFGIEVVSGMCEQLLAQGAPGLHFYTMNQSVPTLRICANLGLSPAR
ncbi:MAG: methylenetetrahydrofolate reductase [NAD(P)H] [Candidatus Sedimenticola endophacoides]|uniref:Methylenetetrahydrofolate reductase n=1 Tax=Candidatus Sedimenticola endophacoides TaxID=2548426 RepID=A0A657Q0H5_9GAMM|nr:MAG: methylenetetrahydrofolate reductase [NAD(P)H] [Candidatus Sedimenticola endophacoides]OQX35492.1 MAG: methylenetetrahydrofolate reductase [NAD(P)H] [Candidatus Sedimenticola endophacoides]OQX35507.1 MAG: methylenetetrahydrofolate reductase [NAD(P)H] [Candidatus Sedimenticola endophacoides]OQX40663.1 MAG: methylenetetrahydrofolate reductase [NAD(P)H] [Candidatus Sedimenticola endophacoides]OQX41820.1 MAG: methylenetetrahydrofolate reductase [NAD(P)H] [Candidatus Sedimenticola endophacoid